MKFFVGQRVRIVWSFHFPELAGKEGTITNRTDPRLPTDDGCGAWRVAPDCWGSDRSPDTYDFFCPAPGAIEPILPSTAADILAMRELPEGPVREVVT